jgi:hypothetical protein
MACQLLISGWAVGIFLARLIGREAFVILRLFSLGCLCVGSVARAQLVILGRFLFPHLSSHISEGEDQWYFG